MKVNHYKITILLLLFSFSAFAQKDSIRKQGYYISLNGGVSLPAGDFKSTTYLGLGGYALNGYGGTVQLEKVFKPGFLGIAFEASYYVNQFNLPAFENAMTPYIDKYPFIHYTFSGASPYKQTPLLIGVFSEGYFHKFTLQFKLNVGLDILTLPYVNNQVTVGFSSFPIIVYPTTMNLLYASPPSVNFAYSTEISLRYSFTKSISIRAKDYFLSMLRNTPDYFPTPFFQMHLELGVVYKLDR